MGAVTGGVQAGVVALPSALDGYAVSRQAGRLASSRQTFAEPRLSDPPLLLGPWDTERT